MLYRQDRDFDLEEREVAEAHFDVYTSRAAVPHDSLVVGRNSVLPYYAELQTDLYWRRSRLINDYSQHRKVADIWQWDLDGLTFPVWTWEQYLRTGYEDKVVLKGTTNSRKGKWKTHMFACNPKEALQVRLRLLDDDLITQQGMVVRPFVPLRQLGETVHGMPVSEEYRCFMYRDQVLSVGFYWSSVLEDIEYRPDNSIVPTDLLAEVAERVDCPAYVVDLARDANGRWWVVELNDLQMSGLSECDPDEMYGNLARCLTK